MKNHSIPELKKFANTIRQDIIKMLAKAGSGHTAGPLGMADVFTVLYFKILNHRPQNPHWPNRDRLILSNGHICPALYATLARAGYFSLSKLNSLRQINSPLQGHPLRNSPSGIESTSGPLGQGISVATGIALAAKIDQKEHKVFCLLSDAEHQEGQTWEAIMFSAHYKLDNLIAIIDRNQIQISGQTEKIMAIEPLGEKYETFGWEVLEMDGHNFDQIIKTVNKAKTLSRKPIAIIAHTIPGKGVSFMEGDYQWHGKAPSKEEAERALRELVKLV